MVVLRIDLVGDVHGNVDFLARLVSDDRFGLVLPSLLLQRYLGRVVTGLEGDVSRIVRRFSFVLVLHAAVVQRSVDLEADHVDDESVVLRFRRRFVGCRAGSTRHREQARAGSAGQEDVPS